MFPYDQVIQIPYHAPGHSHHMSAKDFPLGTDLYSYAPPASSIAGELIMGNSSLDVWKKCFLTRVVKLECLEWSPNFQPWRCSTHTLPSQSLTGVLTHAVIV